MSEINGTIQVIVKHKTVKETKQKNKHDKVFKCDLELTREEASEFVSEEFATRAFCSQYRELIDGEENIGYHGDVTVDGPEVKFGDHEVTIVSEAFKKGDGLTFTTRPQVVGPVVGHTGADRVSVPLKLTTSSQKVSDFLERHIGDTTLKMAFRSVDPEDVQEDIEDAA